ncbi:MAG: MotA/TolQ/ExbB proton channel family protein [Candidatus Tectomicrobia bacterium]
MTTIRWMTPLDDLERRLQAGRSPQAVRASPGQSAQRLQPLADLPYAAFVTSEPVYDVMFAEAFVTVDDMQSYHNLLYKWLLSNSLATLVLYVAWLQGWITRVVQSDASYITWVIALVFLVFWLLSSYHVFHYNREQARFAEGHSAGIAADYYAKLRMKSQNQRGAVVDQTMLASTLRLRLTQSIHTIHHASNTLILLGLIGTVVGFVIAVSGLGDSIGQGAGLGRVKGVLGQIVDGMGIALFTTLVGSVLGGIWLQVHYQMLQRAVTNLVIDIVEHVEVDILPKLAVAREADNSDA